MVHGNKVKELISPTQNENENENEDEDENGNGNGNGKQELEANILYFCTIPIHPMKLKLHLFVLFCFLLKGAVSQNITDIINLGGTGNSERLSSITTDSQGNIYMLHLMLGNAMFGNTQVPITYPNATFRTHVTKLNANRQLVWMKDFNYYPPAETKGNRIAVDAAGNVYITDQYFGSFEGGSFTLTGSGYRNFTYKLDPNGNVLWAVNGGGKNISIAPNGDLELIQYNIASGSVNGSPITNASGTVVWMNPSDGSYVNHFQYNTPTFGTEIILGRNAAGNFYGYRRIGAENSAYYNSSFELMEVSPAGVLLSSALTHYGHNTSPISIAQDPATGHYYISSHFNDRVPLNSPTSVLVNRFGILRLDQNMQVIGKIYLGGPTGSNLVDIFNLAFINGGLYLAGKMQTPSQINNWTCIGQQNYLYPHDDKLIIGKLSKDLDVRWYNSIPGYYYTNSLERPIKHNDDVIFSGTQMGFTMNGLTFTTNGPNDVFLLNVFDTDTTNILIEGAVFHDLNQDGIKQAGEAGIPYRQIGSSSMSGTTSYTREDGRFSATGTYGQQTIYSQDIPTYWTHSTPDSIDVEALQTDTTIQEINFGCYPVPGITDVSATILPLTAARPGFHATYRAEVCNDATDTSSGIFYLKQSPHLTYISSTLSPDSIHQDTLFFSYSNLAPGNCFSVEITDQVFNGTVLGTNLHQQMGIIPQTPDTLESNNTHFILHTVTGSYDPNDISVSPACGVTSNFVANGGSLDYLIRFQNTGSDTAFTVIIKDSLSPLLDVSTFEFKGTSHGVSATISNHVLTLLYDNILLTDSTTSNAESKGWFSYSIKPLASVVTGNTINNTAAIFFDYNAPIITNTTHTIISNPSDLASVAVEDETCGGNGSLSYEAFCGTNGHFISLNGGPFTFDESGVIPNLDAGVYSLRISNFVDTLVMGPVTIQYTPVSGSSSLSVCTGDSVLIGANWQHVPGIYTDTLSTAAGCDSVIHITLMQYSLPITNSSQFICFGDSAFIGGAWQQTAGVYTDILQSVSGCDSIVITNLDLYGNQTSNQSLVICAGDSLFVGGAWQQTAGVYTDILQSVSGCDSIVITNLDLHGNQASDQSLVICAGDSLFVGGAWQQTAGVYTDVLQSIFGCDSTVTTTLSVQTAPDLTISMSNNVLTAPAPPVGANYQWVDCQNNYASISGETGTTFTPLTSGVYALQTTNGNCSFLSNCIAVTILGMPEIHTGTISVSPNPFDAFLKISFDEPETGLLVLSETSGKVVLQQAVNSEENVSVHTGNIAHGMYILTIFRSNGELLTMEKVVK